MVFLGNVAKGVLKSYPGLSFGKPESPVWSTADSIFEGGIVRKGVWEANFHCFSNEAVCNVHGASSPFSA